eukprot:scaffold8850_cov134-Isochrysis_galbana.AAC.23
MWDSATGKKSMSPCSAASATSAAASSGETYADSTKHTVTLRPTSGLLSHEARAKARRRKPAGPGSEGTPNRAKARSLIRAESAEQRSGPASGASAAVRSDSASRSCLSSLPASGRPPVAPSAMAAEAESRAGASASGSGGPGGGGGLGSSAA